MTRREFFAGGGVRAELLAAANRRPCYAEEMFHRAVDCTIPEHKRMYFSFARRAKATVLEG